MNRVELQQALELRFNLEELRGLCFQMHIDHEIFAPSKHDFSRELIEYCERTNNVNQLIEICKKTRPNYSDWEYSTSSFTDLLAGQTLEENTPKRKVLGYFYRTTTFGVVIVFIAIILYAIIFDDKLPTPTATPTATPTTTPTAIPTATATIILEEIVDEGDGRTVREGMHACPVGWFIVGVQDNYSKFLCSNAFGSYQESQEEIDGKNDLRTIRLGMHACPGGTAVTGFHKELNWLLCAPLNDVVYKQVIYGNDDNELIERKGIGACPEGSVIQGINVSENDLLCGQLRK